MKNAFLALPAVLTVAGCATAGDNSAEISDRAAARLAEFERTGDVETCLNVSRITQMTALDERHLLVRSGVNDYYLNEISGRCANADRISYRLQYTVSAGQLCRNDIVQVVDNSSGIIAGSCGLSGFEKLEKKPVE